MIEPSPHVLPCPADIGLLLRAHGEQQWLLSQVVPLVDQLRSPGEVPDEQLGAALAYLEVLWLDARRRAELTDAAAALLGADEASSALARQAHRYLGAVESLRRELAAHVALLTHCSPLSRRRPWRAAAS